MKTTRWRIQRYAEAQFKLYEALLEWTWFKNPQDIERRDFWKAVSTHRFSCKRKYEAYHKNVGEPWFTQIASKKEND
jgi:hypothetical protein